MEVRIDQLNDKHIFLNFVNDTGPYPFMYTRKTGRLSRCLCIHGSVFKGNRTQLCYHAKLVVHFLEEECNIRGVVA